MSDLDLDALERLAAEATPGPWTVSTNDCGSIWFLHEGDDIGSLGEVDMVADAAFICAAREAVPALVAELRRIDAVAANQDARRRRQVTNPYTSDADELQRSRPVDPGDVSEAFLPRPQATQEERILMSALAKCWAERDAAYANLREVQRRSTEQQEEIRGLRAKLKASHEKTTELKAALAAKGST